MFINMRENLKAQKKRSKSSLHKNQTFLHTKNKHHNQNLKKRNKRENIFATHITEKKLIFSREKQAKIYIQKYIRFSEKKIEKNFQPHS